MLPEDVSAFAGRVGGDHSSRRVFRLTPHCHFTIRLELKPPKTSLPAQHLKVCVVNRVRARRPPPGIVDHLRRVPTKDRDRVAHALGPPAPARPGSCRSQRARAPRPSSASRRGRQDTPPPSQH